MPLYRRMRVPGGTYFFTVNLADRRRSLLVEHVDMLRHIMTAVRASHPFHIDAIIILPEHLHALWTLPAGDADYSTRWNRIKGDFTRQLPQTETARNAASASRHRRREQDIWQRRFWEHTVRDEDDFNRHVDYIHYNPVKHGLVKRPIDWPYSSIHRYVEKGILPADWGTLEVPKDQDWD